MEIVPGAIHDVAVIGGGFAGLSAATALAEAGRRVIVLEARPGLGGRASSFTDPATGERVDNGQHLLIGGYHETFRFLRRVGSQDSVRLQQRLSVDFVDVDGVRSRLTSVALPAPTSSRVRTRAKRPGWISNGHWVRTSCASASTTSRMSRTTTSSIRVRIACSMKCAPSTCPISRTARPAPPA